MVAAAVALKLAVVAPAATVTDAGTVSNGLLLVKVTLPAALKAAVLLAYVPAGLWFHCAAYVPGAEVIRCAQPLPLIAESLRKVFPDKMPVILPATGASEITMPAPALVVTAAPDGVALTP